MTTPIAAGVGLGSTILGGVFGGLGKEQAYNAQAGVYGYQAQVAKINQQIDLQNSDYALQQGEVQAQQYGERAAQTMGQIKAAQGASNIDVTSGSSVDVQQSQTKLTHLDFDQIRANAAKTAYDYKVQSTQDLNQAGLYNYASANAKQAGKMALVSSIVGTAGSVSSKWLAGQQSGIFGGSGGNIGGSSSQALGT